MLAGVIGLGGGEGGLDLLTLGADHVLLLRPLAGQQVGVTRLGLGEARLGARDFLFGQGRVDGEECVALLDPVAAFEGPGDQAAGDGWRHQGRLAFDVAQVTRRCRIHSGGDERPLGGPVCGDRRTSYGDGTNQQRELHDCGSRPKLHRRGRWG